MTDSDHQRSVVERYLAAHSRSDVDGIVALFAADATVRDPADAEPFVGVDAIRGFFSSTHETMDSLTLTLDGPVRCCGEFAAFPMTARAVMGSVDVTRVAKGGAWPGFGAELAGDGTPAGIPLNPTCCAPTREPVGAPVV